MEKYNVGRTTAWDFECNGSTADRFFIRRRRRRSLRPSRVPRWSRARPRVPWPVTKINREPKSGGETNSKKYRCGKNSEQTLKRNKKKHSYAQNDSDRRAGGETTSFGKMHFVPTYTYLHDVKREENPLKNGWMTN